MISAETSTTLAGRELQDDELIARFLAGDSSGVDLLFQKYRLIAYKVAYRLLGNEADALDAVQDAFVNALTNLERFRGHSSFKTWLMRVVSNAAFDLGRQRRRRENQANLLRSESQETGELIPPDAGLEREDLGRLIHAALDRLPEAQRQTFVLHVDAGMTYKEVAETLGISIGTVMSRLFYARQRLKLELSHHISS